MKWEEHETKQVADCFLIKFNLLLNLINHSIGLCALTVFFFFSSKIGSVNIWWNLGHITVRFHFLTHSCFLFWELEILELSFLISIHCKIVSCDLEGHFISLSIRGLLVFF